MSNHSFLSKKMNRLSQNFQFNSEAAQVQFVQGIVISKNISMLYDLSF